MNINNILALVIMGVIIQISIQIYHIRHCLVSEQLTFNKKRFWVLVILVFNVPAIIAYLLKTKKKSTDHSGIRLDDSIDDNVRHSIFLSLILAYEILSIDYLTKYNMNQYMVILLSFYLGITMLWHYYKTEKLKVLYYSIPVIQVLLVVIADYMSVSSEYNFSIFLVVAIIINDYSVDYLKIFFVIPMILHIVFGLTKLLANSYVITSDDIITFILVNSIKYVFVFSMFYVAKKQLILNNRLKILMGELKEKTQTLEEMSVLRERNRIAREIHDTIGHTLTGAIVQLEVAKKMVYINEKKAVEAIEKSQNITRTGFADVKRAIKALRPIMIEENTLEDALYFLFERVESDFKCRINYTIQLPEVVSEDIKVSVYRIVQELITNSIRHGEANMMELRIDYHNGNIRIDTKDNGKGCKDIHEGYGLIGIRERVDSFDGQIHFFSKENEGFSSFITIPIIENTM